MKTTTKRMRIVIFCTTPAGRHRWQWVPGMYATPEHPYIERRCSRCRQYEADVLG